MTLKSSSWEAQLQHWPLHGERCTCTKTLAHTLSKCCNEQETGGGRAAFHRAEHWCVGLRCLCPHQHSCCLLKRAAEGRQPRQIHTDAGTQSRHRRANTWPMSETGTQACKSACLQNTLLTTHFQYTPKWAIKTSFNKKHPVAPRTPVCVPRKRFLLFKWEDLRVSCFSNVGKQKKAKTRLEMNLIESCGC